MFDDKAKEYTRKQKIISGDRLVEKAFKDGAVYGYKVGFEECTKSEWHDLRKNPKDLPKGHKVVLNQVGMATQYDPSRGFWVLAEQELLLGVKSLFLKRSKICT